jgi:hypothetical protein
VTAREAVRHGCHVSGKSAGKALLDRISVIFPYFRNLLLDIVGSQLECYTGYLISTLRKVSSIEFHRSLERRNR